MLTLVKVAARTTKEGEEEGPSLTVAPWGENSVLQKPSGCPKNCHGINCEDCSENHVRFELDLKEPVFMFFKKVEAILPIRT